MTNAKRAYEDKTLSKIDQSQLAAVNNTVDMNNEGQDFAYDLGDNRTPDSKERSNPNFERFEEMNRFNRDATETARKLTKRID